MFTNFRQIWQVGLVAAINAEQCLLKLVISPGVKYDLVTLLETEF